MASRHRSTNRSRQSGRTAAQRERTQRAHIRRLRMEQVEKQEQKRSWIRTGLPMWARTLVAVGAVLLLILVFFRVDEFEVSGNVRYTAEEVADASGVTKGDVLMGVNKTQAASRILIKLPYVQQVEVAKVLPGAVRFTVVECQAVMAAESEFGTVWLMNEDGKLLEKLDNDEEIAYPFIQGVVLDLPTAGDPAVFEDPERGEAAMEAVREIRAARQQEHIRIVDVTDLEQIALSYDDRVEVRLGDGGDLAYKLQYMAAAMERLGDSAHGALDVSFSTGDRAVFHPLES